MESYILSDDFKQCYICKKVTNKIDISTEQRICSEECEKISTKIYNDWLKEVELKEKNSEFISE